MAEPIRFSVKQAAFIDAALSGQYLFLAYGGGIFSGKSYVALGVLIMLCRMYPGSRWAVVRKDLPTIRRNVIPTFERLRPRDFLGPIVQDVWTSRAINGSEIIFFPEQAERDPELNRWKGLNVNGFLYDEGNECSVQAWNKGIERAGTWICPNGLQPDPLLMITFNPNDDWPRGMFYEPHHTGTLRPPYFYQPATIIDNLYAPPKLLESLKNLPKAEYDRFVLGRWDQNAKPNQLIHPEWITAARTRPKLPMTGFKIGADIAREGDDSTVFMKTNGDNLISWQDFQKIHTDVAADYITVYASEPDAPVNADQIRVDSVGLGAGTYDSLVRNLWYVKEFIAGASPVERLDDEGKPLSIFQFPNLRSQAWWEFREKLRLGLFWLPANIPERLVSDLLAMTYTIKGDKELQVTPKDKMKLKIGRSPDWGDALVMAAFDFPEEVVPAGAPAEVARSSPYGSY